MPAVFKYSYPKTLLLFPLWFACFWALLGTMWRPPLASTCLLTLFLALIFLIEWLPRRLAVKNIAKKMESQNINIQQQIVRSKTSAGVERIEGIFVADFPEGAAAATIHVPICPAFNEIPKVQIFPLDETDAVLRITSSKPFGLRIDVKRSETVCCPIRFTVVAEG